VLLGSCGSGSSTSKEPTAVITTAPDDTTPTSGAGSRSTSTGSGGGRATSTGVPPTVTTTGSTLPGGGTVPTDVEQPGSIILLDASGELTRPCNDDGLAVGDPAGDTRDHGDAGVRLRWSATGADHVVIRSDDWVYESTVAPSGSLDFDAVPCVRGAPMVILVSSWNASELLRKATVSIGSA
jgi:hypothetical protein